MERLLGGWRSHWHGPGVSCRFNLHIFASRQPLEKAKKLLRVARLAFFAVGDKFPYSLIEAGPANGRRRRSLRCLSFGELFLDASPATRHNVVIAFISTALSKHIVCDAVCEQVVLLELLRMAAWGWTIEAIDSLA